MPAFVEQRAWQQLTWRDSFPFFLGGGFTYFFLIFSPTYGNGLNLTIYNVFHMGWFNHHLEFYSFYEAFQKTPRNIQVKFKTFDDISMEAHADGVRNFFFDGSFAKAEGIDEQ